MMIKQMVQKFKRKWIFLIRLTKYYAFHCEFRKINLQKGEICMEITYTIFDSLIGTLFTAFSRRGMCALQFFRDEKSHLDELKERFGFEPVLDASLTRTVIRFVNNYLAGNRPMYSWNVDLTGLSGFDKKALESIMNLPYGRVATYADVAVKMGGKNLARAVGNAMSHNPVIIIVPCHRIVASDGSLGGYGGGLDVKRRLLEIEGVTVFGGKIELQKFRAPL